MKEGWEYKKFKDICFSICDGDWIESKDQSTTGIRLIQTGNIGVGKFIPKEDSKKFISKDTFIRLRCTEVEEGDILISRLPNPLGRSCMIPKLSTQCITAVDCSILKINKKIVAPQFFLYYTQSSKYFSIIDNQSSGTTRARITRKKLEETSLPVPPLSEQQSIVAYLDSAFAKIDTMKANAEKALNEAKALFQASLKEMLEPKVGWEEKTFGEVCWFNKNNGLHRGTRYVGMEHIEQGTGNLLGTISSDEVASNTFAFDKGDVLYGRLRPYLKKVIVAEFDGCCSTEIFPIQSKKILASFLMYWFLTDKITNKVNATCAGCRMPRGNMNDVLKFKISYPSLNDQQNIVTILDSIKSKVDRLQSNFDNISQECDALKQALLRQVFE